MLCISGFRFLFYLLHAGLFYKHLAQIKKQIMYTGTIPNQKPIFDKTNLTDHILLSLK